MRRKLTFHKEVGALKRKWTLCPPNTQEKLGNLRRDVTEHIYASDVVRWSEDTKFCSKTGILTGGWGWHHRVEKVIESELQLLSLLPMKPYATYLTSLGFNFVCEVGVIIVVIL